MHKAKFVMGYNCGEMYKLLGGKIQIFLPHHLQMIEMKLKVSHYVLQISFIQEGMARNKNDTKHLICVEL